MSDSKIKVGLVEINNTFSGQHYLPYSLGSLVTYAKKYLNNPDDFEFLSPFYYRIPVEETLERLLKADAVLFSTYVWNIRISLEIAKQIKLKRPDILTIFGGPQIPDRSENFLRKNRFVDIACHNEGEQVFLKILENMTSKNWHQAPGISFLKGDESFVQNAKPSRIKDLTQCPSPYLEGFFDSLMERNPQEKWMCVWETNRGCPFSCAFCDWGSATQSRVFQFDMEKVVKEIEWFGKNRLDFVFCADANFGILPRDIEIVNYFVEVKKKYGFPRALQVLSTKNATERAYQVHKILADAGLNKGVTVSFQSLDPNALENIKRGNISTKTFHELQRRFKEDNVGTYTDLILGLPGETYESFVNGVSLLIENGQHDRIQFNNLSILPNAEMGHPEYQKKHGMIVVETKIVSMHGSFEEEESEDTWERQLLSVGTHTMPKEDWVKTRAFAWMVSLLHFDKIFQIPLVVVHKICSVAYRDLFEIFMGDLGNDFPILKSVQAFFFAKARDIQNGGTDNCHSKEWLNIFWPEDEFILVKLCREENLEAFYEECAKAMQTFLQERFIQLPPRLLQEAILLNKALVKLPFQKENLHLELSYNIYEYYRSVLKGNVIPLENKMSCYQIDRTSQTWSSWDDWCREVVWYGNKKGAYLYDGNFTVEPQPAGHS